MNRGLGNTGKFTPLYDQSFARTSLSSYAFRLVQDQKERNRSWGFLHLHPWQLFCYWRAPGDRYQVQTADERFQSLFAHGRGFFSWRNPLARCRHFQQLAEAAFIIFQNDVTLYEIFEFAKISGPGITYGGFHQMLGRNHGLLVEFLAVLLKEMAEEQRNFRGPLAQRRDVDGEHVQAVVQIFTEAARFHRFLNLHVGCGEHPDIHINQLASAQARKLVILQDVQKFRLQMGAHFRDFVEEDSSLRCQLKFARFGTHRAGKRALFKAEQFGFEQLARERGAIHLDEGLITSSRSHVNQARDDFFSNSAFPIDEHGDVDRSDLQDLLANSHHLWAGSEEAQVFRNRVAVFAQSFVFRA